MLCDIPENKLDHVAQQEHLLLPKSRFDADGVVICFVLLHTETSNLFLFSIVRLSKLETFHKMVVEELSSLEKETQVLAKMEKDAVVCMTSCVLTHRNSSSNGSFLWDSS